GKYTQAALDVRTHVILYYFSDKSLINRGFVDLTSYFDTALWASNAVIENGTISNIVEDSGKVVGSTGLSHMSGSVIYCFDVELGIAPDQFLGIGLNLYNSAYQYVGTNRGYFMCIKDSLIELQKTDGSSNAVIDVKDVAICDGQKHSICWGVINTAAGCHVIAIIDGEIVFSYSDTTDTAPTDVPMQFVTSTTGKLGNSIILSKSKTMPTAEEFEAIVKNAEYKAAQSVLATFPDVTGLKVIKANASKILTEDAIIDVSYAMPEYKNDSMMIPAMAVAKMFGGVANANRNGVTLTVRDVTMGFVDGAASYIAGSETKTSKQSAYMKNGYLMIAVQDVLSAIGIELSDDFFNGMSTITDTGSVNTVNEARQLAKSSAIIDKIMSYNDTNDVYFKDLK
ncbi:MAG: hypothetical protein II978_02825, partial [Clostridia bacterium]|nr:hypothetical protein [Clostridia bacterium]